MPIHPEARALMAMIAAWQETQGLPPRAEQTLALQRDVGRRMAAIRRRGPVEPMAAIEELALPTRGGPRRARLYRPPGGPGRFTLVYIHGGGYVVGGIDDTEHECRRLAASLGVDVVAISYRLAPEHPWPAGFDDAEDAVRALASGAIPGLAPRFVLAGVSAGAGLAAAATRRLVTAGESPVALLVLMSPWLDMTMTLPATELFARGYMLERDSLVGFCRVTIPPDVAADHPELSAARHPVPAGWPPTMLFAAECDPLVDDTALFARRLAEAGVEHDVRFVPGMLHGFHGWWDHLPAIAPDIAWLDATIGRRMGL
ncbi:alpha/beta hydrolase fold domain-containing protein [Alsobacter sp. R-9]